MVCRPEIWLSCLSRGAVTRAAIVSALAPGSWVVIWIVGKSTCGRDEIGRRRYPRMLPSSTAIARSAVAIGLAMKGAEMFMRCSWGHSRHPGRLGRRGIALASRIRVARGGLADGLRLSGGHADLGAVLQIGEATRHDALAGRDAFGNHGLGFVLLGHLNRR